MGGGVKLKRVQCFMLVIWFGSGRSVVNARREDLIEEGTQSIRDTRTITTPTIPGVRQLRSKTRGGRRSSLERMRLEEHKRLRLAATALRMGSSSFG